jgi:hypothetical protein
LEADLWTLEVASTIAYFRRSGSDWLQARQRACRFKKVDPQSEFAAEAERLARTAIE